MDTVSRVDNHMVVLDARDPTCDVVQAVNCLTCDDSCQPSREPTAIVQVPERAVKTRRRHFKRVRVVKREVSVENRAQIPADSLTIIEVDRLSSRDGVDLKICLWSVDENSEHPPKRLSTELHVKDLKPKTAGDALRNRPDLEHKIFVAHRHLQGVLRHLKHKKWANAHFCRIDVSANISCRKRHRQRWPNQEGSRTEARQGVSR